RPRPPSPTLFPYTTLFRSATDWVGPHERRGVLAADRLDQRHAGPQPADAGGREDVGHLLQQFDVVRAVPRLVEFELPVQFFLLEDRKNTRLNSSHVKISYA